MASSREKDVSVEMEALLECPICMETLREPRSLPCFHNFCKVCLEKYVEGLRDATDGDINMETFPCPTCRSQFTLKVNQTVAEMPGNYVIRNMLEVMEKQQEAKEVGVDLNNKSVASTFAPGTELTAIFTFQNRNREELQFEEGDTLIVVEKIEDPDWLKAKDMWGNVGYIPVNYVQKKKEKATVQLHKMPWFHGTIDRKQAEKLLMKSPEDGLFLVRESFNYPGDFSLCHCFERKVEHYRVKYQDDKLTIDEESMFTNLTQLVEHYARNADGLICRLTKPLKKVGTVAVSVDVESFKKCGWHVPREELDLINVVAHGESIGDVWEGRLNQKRVAVKCLQEGRTARNFLTEAAVMTRLNHKNLVMLLGVSLDSSPILIITEFCDKGILVEYLRSQTRARITKKDLIGFVRDVAEGMRYLESQNLVHRNLAARNVLLDENAMAKVANFDLAGEQAVSVTGELPVKWTAPEALKDENFSSKSDVWSFSIFLWEIYSFGCVPYWRIPLTDVVTRVVKGFRMDKPKACSDQMFALMAECWAPYPSDPPTFKTIVEKLKAFKDED